MNGNKIYLHKFLLQAFHPNIQLLLCSSKLQRQPQDAYLRPLPPSSQACVCLFSRSRGVLFIIHLYIALLRLRRTTQSSSSFIVIYISQIYVYRKLTQPATEACMFSIISHACLPGMAPRYPFLTFYPVKYFSTTIHPHPLWTRTICSCPGKHLQ